MKIDSKVTGLLNAKLKDLEVEIALYKNINGLKKLAGNQIPSIDSFLSEFEDRLSGRLSVEKVPEFEKFLEGLANSYYKVSNKTALYLTLDNKVAEFTRAGGQDSLKKEVEILKESLEKELFFVYNVTEDDFKTKEESNV